MTHLNSAVKLLDRAAEKFNDKIAISDEWSEISFSELQRKGKAVGTALAKTTPQGYMPAPVMVYLKKSISCLVCLWVRCTVQIRMCLPLTICLRTEYRKLLTHFKAEVI